MGFYYFKARIYNETENKTTTEQGFVVGTSLPEAFRILTTKYYDENMIEDILRFTPVTEDFSDVVLLPNTAEINMRDLLKENFGWLAD